jgi:hypothetical protein
MLKSLKSLLMTAQSMRGHAKGRELRRRAFERIKSSIRRRASASRSRWASRTHRRIGAATDERHRQKTPPHRGRPESGEDHRACARILRQRRSSSIAG